MVMATNADMSDEEVQQRRGRLAYEAAAAHDASDAKGEARAERELASIEAELEARRHSAERAELVEAERTARDQAAAEEVQQRRVAALEAKLHDCDERHATLLTQVDEHALAIHALAGQLRDVVHEAEVAAGELGRSSFYYGHRFRLVGERLNGALAHDWPGPFRWQDGGGLVAERDAEDQA
jgi:hypothetical protein